MTQITNFALRAYQDAARTTAAPQEGRAVEAGRSFQNVLAAAEEQAGLAVSGSADPHALVEALASSQLAVETAVTIRDRVVEAYQEILRMPM